MGRALGIALVAAALAHAAAAPAAARSNLAQAASGVPDVYSVDPGLTRMYQRLTTPLGIKDDWFVSKYDQQAQQRSNAIFNQLVSLLGGGSPTLNHVAPNSLGTSGGVVSHLSATPSANRINIDPYATVGLIAKNAITHDGALNQVPHEMAHLRQVTTTRPDREGGAQAFADLVAETAADRANIPNSLAAQPAGQFDGAYATYVKQADARGRNWILGGQFGKTAPAVWP